MKSRFLSGPYIVWMLLFTLIPLGVVVYYAFTDSVTGQFTLTNLSGMVDYLPIFLRSIWLSVFATLICLVIGYPVAYFIASCKPSTQRFLQMLIMLPMCMSFLLRTLAWVGMLEDTGILNTILQRLGIGPLPLIRTNGAVILGMVYNYLPYMILPLYSVIMKIDNRLIEAALDLGCRPSQVFSKVILPLSGPGILSAVAGGFASCGVSIRSNALYHLPDNRAAMVFGTELEDTTELEAALQAAGYPIYWKLKNE